MSVQESDQWWKAGQLQAKSGNSMIEAPTQLHNAVSNHLPNKLLKSVVHSSDNDEWTVTFDTPASINRATPLYEKDFKKLFEAGLVDMLFNKDITVFRFRIKKA